MGATSGRVEVHEVARLSARRPRSPRSSATTAGCSSGEPRRGDRRVRERIGSGAKRRSSRQTGSWRSTLETKRDAGVPYVYRLEGDVEDASRQHIANRASVVVHPAPWYIGVRRPSYFLDQKAGLKTEIVAVGPRRPCRRGRSGGGDADADPVDERAPCRRQRLLHVGHRAEGGPGGKWNGDDRARIRCRSTFPSSSGGYFSARSDRPSGADGRFAVTRTRFYVLGEGYTAWARFDHNRIELVPERQTWKPGDTARIMIQSPWEQATALVTTEREGIRSHRQFALTSTQQSISIPITEADIPNVFVSVVLVKGRTDRRAAG